MGLMDRFKMTSKAWAKTIVAFEPPHRLQDLGTKGSGRRQQPAGVAGDEFKIRLAQSDERTREASFLVQKRYSDVGYKGQAATSQRSICPEQITLLSYHQEKVVGTLTLGLDIGQGLFADELYRAEVDKLRAEGRKLCEITKLAVDTKHASKNILAALMHIAYIYARKIWRYTDVVVEVNPSHVAFYKKMLGFTEIGSERICPRVNAPAVLLWVEISYMEKKIAALGGGVSDSAERTLYKYFFNNADELNITKRLMFNEQQP